MSKFLEPEIFVDVAAEEITALTKDQKDLVDPLGSGFTWYTPPMAFPGKEHESRGNKEWSIAGHDFQVLTMTLAPSDTVITEVGSFMFGSSDITMNVELTLCSGCEGCQRICGGESCVKLLLMNAGSQQGVRHSLDCVSLEALKYLCLMFFLPAQYVGMTPSFPAKIIPIQFGKHVNANHALIAQGGAYMSQIGDIGVGAYKEKCLVTENLRSVLTTNSLFDLALSLRV